MIDLRADKMKLKQFEMGLLANLLANIELCHFVGHVVLSRPRQVLNSWIEQNRINMKLRKL